jgi:hypothetical protein
MKRWWLGALFLALPSGAAAQEKLGDAHKEVCADAYDNSQVLRDDKQLMLARAQLAVCQRACPQKLAADCQRWQTEIEARLASVELEARDQLNRPVKTRVRIDDRPAEPLPAGEVLLEPGEHRFVFEREHGRAIEESVTLKEGEKRRRVVASFSDGAPLKIAEDGMAPNEVTAIVLTSVGNVGLIVAGALAIKGHVDRGDLFDCRPNCPQEDVDQVRTTWMASGIVAGIGGAMLGTALVVWLVGGENDSDVASLRVRF